jgi:hypothetical protein
MSEVVICLLLAIPPAVWLGLLIVAMLMRGPKLDGVISLVAAVAGNALQIRFTLRGLPRPPPVWQEFRELSVSLILFGTWLGFAVIAIKTWRLPNSLIGGLSLAFLASPGVLFLVQWYCWFLGFLTR